jgi:hypothetical protein
MIREGRSAEVQVLMRLAMERPKAFSNVLRRPANAPKELAGFGAK